MDFSGVITALATPFKGGVLDRDSFFRILKSQADEGISQFVIMGQQGKALFWKRGRFKGSAPGSGSLKAKAAGRSG